MNFHVKKKELYILAFVGSKHTWGLVEVVWLQIGPHILAHSSDWRTLGCSWSPPAPFYTHIHTHTQAQSKVLLNAILWTTLFSILLKWILTSDNQLIHHHCNSDCYSRPATSCRQCVSDSACHLHLIHHLSAHQPSIYPISLSTLSTPYSRSSMLP